MTPTQKTKPETCVSSSPLFSLFLLLQCTFVCCYHLHIPLPSLPCKITIISLYYHYHFHVLSLSPPYAVLIISIYFHSHFHTLLPLYAIMLTCVYLSPVCTIAPYTSSLKISQVCGLSSFSFQIIILKQSSYFQSCLPVVHSSHFS